MMPFKKRNFLVVGLSACIVGLAICPYLYVVAGALFSFSFLFSLLMLPPLLLSSGFLLWRFLSKPEDQPMRIKSRILEGVSWIMIAVFVVMISDFKLQTNFEKFGLFCTFFLLTSICCLPLVMMRETALKKRLTQISNGLSKNVFILIWILSVLMMIIYFLNAPDFI